MTRTKIRLLLVEDDPSAAELVREALADCKRPKFEVIDAGRLSQAMELLAQGGIDLVLSDLGLPDATGLESCERLLEVHPDVPLIVLTGLDDEAVGMQAVQRGAQDFLVKSRLDPELLGRSLSYAVERHSMLSKVELAAREARASEARLRNLIGRSAEGSIVLDASRTVLFVNAAAEALLGRPTSELLGSSFDLPLPDGEAREVVFPRPDGTSFPAEMRVTDLEWEGGAASLVSLYDLSDRKRAERVAFAQSVQRAFLPERTEMRVGLLEMSGLNELCEDASGDYYDFVELDDGRFAVPIGDVTGHGLGPALLMAQGRAFLRAFCRTVRDLPGVMERLNDSLSADMSGGRFMTLFLAVVDPRTGTVAWANAGHVPALLLRARTGEIERLEATGTVLGVFPGTAYPAGRGIDLEPGDVLLLCSDGATEATQPGGEQFGEERILEVLRAHAAQGTQAILDGLRSALSAFRGASTLADDLTLVAIRRLEDASAEGEKGRKAPAPAAGRKAREHAATRSSSGGSRSPDTLVR